MKIGKAISIFLISFLIIQASSAQDIELYMQEHVPITFDKIYLHIDRDSYFIGETIWFKAYLLDGQSLYHDTNIQNLYVDLIDSKGKITQHQVLLCENGETSGNILIPDTITTGTFMIRAYTDYLRNFGEELFFHKTLRISKVKNSFELESDQAPMLEEKPEIDVSFFPEGGYLLAGKKNLVAFKAVDKNGKGVSLHGKVLDSLGKTVSVLETYYNGMGYFYITPKMDKYYEVEIENYPGYRHRFNDIRNEAMKLQLLAQTNDKLTLEVVSNTSQQSEQKFFLVCFSKGKLLGYEAIHSLLPLRMTIETVAMQAGINRFILLNEALEPVSERLVFSDNMNVNNLDVKSSQKEYSIRSLVQLDILDEIDNLGCSSLSVAVIDENALNANRGSQNILSYLLLDSELKGIIESPADYFIDDDSITSQDKLNLLMLTHGWSRYLRNTFEENQGDFEYRKTAGISISGKAEKIIGHKPMFNGNVTVGIFEDSFINWHESKTDSTGRFSLDNLIFFDTATVFIQALNEKGKQRSKVLMDTVIIQEPVESPGILKVMKDYRAIPLQLHRQKYFSEAEYCKLHPEDGSIWIEEVEIRENKVEPDDGHFRLYQRADQVLEITDQAYAYPNLIEYLRGRVAGVQIIRKRNSTEGYTIIMRGSSSAKGNTPPLFLLDGFPIVGKIDDIQMSEIDKVEILKGNSAAIYGSRGANGVIAVYLKKGGVSVAKQDLITRTMTNRVIGFSRCREFYSPLYTPENIDSPEPDHRTTLYWNPNITTENGKAEISFFTSDNLSYYRIIIEGITDNGRICMGSAKFAVTERNKNPISIK